MQRAYRRAARPEPLPVPTYRGGALVRTEGRRNYPYGSRGSRSLLTLHRRIEAERAAEPDYEALSRDDLRALAKERGLTGYSKLNKAGLVALLSGVAA